MLMVRETPLHLGHLRSMVALAEMGAIIAPPLPALYAQPAVDRGDDRPVGRARARPVRPGLGQGRAVGRRRSPRSRTPPVEPLGAGASGLRLGRGRAHLPRAAGRARAVRLVPALGALGGRAAARRRRGPRRARGDAGANASRPASSRRCGRRGARSRRRSPASSTRRERRRASASRPTSWRAKRLLLRSLEAMTPTAIAAHDRPGALRGRQRRLGAAAAARALAALASAFSKTAFAAIGGS